MEPQTRTDISGFPDKKGDYRTAAFGVCAGCNRDVMGR
jgi:hypothetical protein